MRTRIGWHLVEVTGRKPMEQRTFEKAKSEVITALEAVKRRDAVTRFRADLRRLEAGKIEVFNDMITW